MGCNPPAKKIKSENQISKKAELYSQKMKEGLDAQNSPKQMVEIFLGLKNIDDYSKYKIEVQISDIDDSKTFHNLGSTIEKQGNNQTINFENSFLFPYYFEVEQALRFTIKNVNSNKMLIIDTIVGMLMGSKSQSLALNLNQQVIPGDLFIQASPVKNININAKMKFSVKFETEINQPYFIIKRGTISNTVVSPDTNNFKGEEEKFVYDNKNWLNVYKSEVLPTNQNSIYYFAEVTISSQLLCNGNLSKPLLIEFYDFLNNKSHGYAIFLLENFNSNNAMKYNLYNESRSNLTAVVSLECNLIRQYSFVEYLAGGLQICLFIAIDFTQSNGDPSEFNSLHYIGGNIPNSYEKVIKTCGDIVAYYDADQLFPVFGYGAILPETHQVNHCFNLNFQVDPNVNTINGVINVYRNSLKFIRLYGPTILAPIIQKTIQYCLNKINVQFYIILMILTDGIINDMSETIDAIVEASFLPISIIIVGIGNADFSNMKTLDSDDRRLSSSKGINAARDLVQFVPYNKFENNVKKLACEVLQEIPRQVEEYFRMKGIPPRENK